MFSIIIPTYNRSARLKTSINSIVCQTNTNWELIIIDDASTDDTYNFVAPFLTDKRIRYFRNKTNIERCNSRNRGILEATGSYICFLDNDDYHLPNHLEALFEEIKKRRFPKAFLFTKAYNETENKVRTDRLCTVAQVLNEVKKLLPSLKIHMDPSDQKLHEAGLVKLDVTKAMTALLWLPKLDFEQTIEFTIKGYLDEQKYTTNLYEARVKQIEAYCSIH